MQDRQRAAAREMLGDVPQLSTVTGLDPTVAPTETQELHGRRSSSTHGRYGMNLPAVAEVLARYGLDPLEEVAKVLTEKVPVLDDGGRPVLDKDGKPTYRNKLAPAEHAKLAAELLQYTRPKLKATEVTIKPPELSDDQIEMRLAALLQTTRKGS